jgi:nucleotide-binding universal stress UspA family protein
MSEGSDTIYQALDDFHQARIRANLEEIFSRLTGSDTRLLSYEEVRQKLKVQGTLDRGIQNIPLNAIIGSANRYEDFTRSFLPRRNVDPKRWAKILVAANGMVGLPPIEVYQIGEVYFVIDGNHRVSVARQMGGTMIQAYVHEVPTHVTIKPDDQLEDVLLKAEYSTFIDETHLDTLRPESNIRFTSPGQYPVLLEHIQSHHYSIQIGQQKSIPYEEAVGDWYDHIYLPVVELIRERSLQHEFFQRTEADLYLWILEHREELETYLQQPVDTLAVITHLAKEHGPSIERRATRISEWIKDTLIPGSLDQGPPPGTWREEKSGDIGGEKKPLQRMFSDILVPVDGTDSGWSVVDQAIIIARRENSRLNGLHISPSRRAVTPETSRIKKIFQQRVEQAKVPGDLTLVSGSVAKTILERSRWNDLVVLYVPHSLQLKRRAKLGSRLHEIILRCNRPILAVHQTVSPLSHPLLAYDESPKAREALFLTTYLAGKWELPITVIGIDEPDKEIPEALENAEDYIRRRIGNEGISLKLVHHSGPIDTSILISAEEENCDWIIMGGYGDSPVTNLLTDNVLDRILSSTSRPVLLCR